MYVIRIKEHFKPFRRTQATYYAGLNRFNQIISFPTRTSAIIRFASMVEAEATRKYLLESVRFFGVGIGYKYRLRIVPEMCIPRTY